MESALSDLKLEQETTIVFNEAEPLAQIWSASRSFQRRMEKAGIPPTKTAPRERGALSAWYEVPRKWIRVRPPIVKQITEEQRKDMAERARVRFARIRVAKQSNSLHESGENTRSEE